jgi:hypothetical protein
MAFLQAGRELALAEQGTVTWYAFKISDTSAITSASSTRRSGRSRRAARTRLRPRLRTGHIP